MRQLEHNWNKKKTTETEATKACSGTRHKKYTFLRIDYINDTAEKLYDRIQKWNNKNPNIAPHDGPTAACNSQRG